MSALAIVDDQSAQIKYTGLWTAGGGNYFQHSAAASRASGATLAFSFSGTFVSLVGSFDANTTCSGTFTLDSNITTFSSPVVSAAKNHQTIWSSPALPDTNHTLTYTVSSCSSTGNAAGYMWIDYLLYAPSANASSNGLLLFLDDTDSRISYSGQWTQETNNTDNFNLTNHGGPQGSSFQLDFEGTLVSVYGSIGNNSAEIATQSSFSIDGTTPVAFSAPVQSGILDNQVLFQSSKLSPGQHTLVATSVSGPLWLDYLLIQPNPTEEETVEPTEHKSSFPVGGIAGAAAGAVVLAAAIALLLIFRRRVFKPRHSRTPSRPLSRPPNLSDLAVAPPSIPRRSYDGSYLESSRGSAVHPPSQVVRQPRSPFDTPPVSPPSSPRTGVHTVRSSSSLAESRIAPSMAESGPSRRAVTPGPATRPFSPLSSTTVPAASSSGHSRRPSEKDFSGADLKRRPTIGTLAPAYDDVASLGGISQTSSFRPLPTTPGAGASSIASHSGTITTQQTQQTYTDSPPDYVPVYKF